jgi:hypothetical protein
LRAAPILRQLDVMSWPRAVQVVTLARSGVQPRIRLTRSTSVVQARTRSTLVVATTSTAVAHRSPIAGRPDGQAALERSEWTGRPDQAAAGSVRKPPAPCLGVSTRAPPRQERVPPAGGDAAPVDRCDTRRAPSRAGGPRPDQRQPGEPAADWRRSTRRFAGLETLAGPTPSCCPQKFTALRRAYRDAAHQRAMGGWAPVLQCAAMDLSRLRALSSRFSECVKNGLDAGLKVRQPRGHVGS